jgi:hypothetical protein
MLTGGMGSILHNPARTRIRPGRLPQQMWIGTARLTIVAFEEATKQATVRYERDFLPPPVIFTAQPQTTYIYVPSVR